MGKGSMNTGAGGSPGAVLWDMDGVLVDTAELHYLTWKSALAVNGISITRADFNNTFGMNNGQVLTYLLGQAPSKALLEEISDRKEKRFRELVCESSSLYPGAIELLSMLHQAGYSQAVASSAPRENIATILDKFDLGPYFQTTVSGHDLPSKPDPAVFLLAAQSLQIAPGKCIVIEDAFAGIQAARNAGMKCIAVGTTNPIEALGEANLAVNNLEELQLADFQNLLQADK